MGLRCVKSAGVGAILFAAAACSGNNDAGAPPGNDAQTPAALASDAYVWGYPLVVTHRTFQTFAGLIGENNLYNQTQLSDVMTPHIVVSPNQDTLYSIAVVDLRSEPMVLTVPDVEDRYWTYQFLDAWTNSFFYLGTRATNGKGGTFVITPPGFSGAIPGGSTEIASPTPLLYLLGRFLVKDAADAANVTALKRSLVGLNTVSGVPAPTGPAALGAPPGKPQEVGTDGASFFDELGDALAVDAPDSDFDTSELARFASLGIGAGLHPAAMATDPNLVATFEAGIADGDAKIADAVNHEATSQNGWTAILQNIGIYDHASLARTAVARWGWGANVPAEAVYPASQADGAGNPYTGANQYVMHFDAGALPPVDPVHGFWSLTLYGPDHFFVDNPINRYAIGDRTEGLVHNADGSLDLFIQNAQPAMAGNWLPAPAGDFLLVLRLYLPGPTVLDGSYVYPPVTVH